MANYYKIISFLLFLGLFLVPISSYACSISEIKVNTTEEANIKSEAAFSTVDNFCESDNCKEKCCHTDTNNCTHNNCNGNCNSTSCAAGGFTFLNSSSFEVKNRLSFLSLKKDNFYHLNPDYSVGFHPIWQPPKIG